MKNKLLLFIPLAVASYKLSSQCINNTANIYSFVVDDIPYDIVKENKTWANAAACAVSLGGKLAEINSKAEQDTIFYYIKQANILPANTVAPDGGNASYLWLGGNDIASEGKWIWDGANIGNTNQFWQGTASGSAVGGSYTNWGNEPDNWNGQDGLGLAITNWPMTPANNWTLGLAGQWNDVKETNQLYFIIEYPKTVTTSLKKIKSSPLSIYPNPANNFITIKSTLDKQKYMLRNSLGSVVKEGLLLPEQKIDISDLATGIYFLSTTNNSIRLVKTE